MIKTNDCFEIKDKMNKKVIWEMPLRSSLRMHEWEKSNCAALHTIHSGRHKIIFNFKTIESLFVEVSLSEEHFACFSLVRERKRDKTKKSRSESFALFVHSYKTSIYRIPLLRRICLFLLCATSKCKKKMQVWAAVVSGGRFKNFFLLPIVFSFHSALSLPPAVAIFIFIIRAFAFSYSAVFFVYR